VTIAQRTRVGRDQRQSPLRGSTVPENALPAVTQTRWEPWAATGAFTGIAIVWIAPSPVLELNSD
jgi:hypothetical protein